jgi:hypothetical protein
VTAIQIAHFSPQEHDRRGSAKTVFPHMSDGDDDDAHDDLVFVLGIVNLKIMDVGLDWKRSKCPK